MRFISRDFMKLWHKIATGSKIFKIWNGYHIQHLAQKKKRERERERLKDKLMASFSYTTISDWVTCLYWYMSHLCRFIYDIVYNDSYIDDSLTLYFKIFVTKCFKSTRFSQSQVFSYQLGWLHCHDSHVLIDIGGISSTTRNPEGYPCDP